MNDEIIQKNKELLWLFCATNTWCRKTFICSSNRTRVFYISQLRNAVDSLTKQGCRQQWTWKPTRSSFPLNSKIILAVIQTHSSESCRAHNPKFLKTHQKTWEYKPPKKSLQSFRNSNLLFGEAFEIQIYVHSLLFISQLHLRTS